jgi:DNA-binding TFAR19-related protein (PDSD5 family)
MPEDSELEQLKRRKLEAMQKRWVASARKKEKDAENPKTTLGRVLVGRGLEVLNVAEQQYPKITPKIVEALAKQISNGQLKGTVNGEQLLWFFRRLGLNVRLKTRIRILEHGELKTIEEKLRAKLQ